jgi:hypothetical protein
MLVAPEQHLTTAIPEVQLGDFDARGTFIVHVDVMEDIAEGGHGVVVHERRGLEASADEWQ